MIFHIKSRLEAKTSEIEEWFAEKWKHVPVPVYASVDIRNSHNKIAVVDTNAFPAGFNNLCPKYTEQVTIAFRDYFSRFENVKKIMIVPELHTRNRFYLENLRRLCHVIEKAGHQVRIGTFDPDLRTDAIELEAIEGRAELFRLKKQDGAIKAGDFKPDLILLNNDFITGVPDILKDLDLPVAPPFGLGWHRRRKNHHFQIMNDLIKEFCRNMDIPPWSMSTYVSWIKNVDYNNPASREEIAAEVEKLIALVREEYKAHDIPDQPFVFIKHNSGTYGMAVTTARSGDEVRKAGRKERTKMSSGKGRSHVNEVLIQEGIPTRDRMDGSPMEPVIYMVGDRAVGGFYRLHPERSEVENLNVRGMEFRRLCFHQVSEKKPQTLDDRCEDSASLMLVYGTLGRLAVLALGIEMKQLEEKG